jgi:hypothetical protein
MGRGGEYRCADLDVELAHGGAVVHGVEGGDLVDAHGRHLEDACHLVHDADAGEAMLPLTQVQNGHHGGLLVLRRVPLEDLGDDSLIGGCELERDVGVVVGSVAVHHEGVASPLRGQRKCAIRNVRPRCSAGGPDGCPHEERGQFARHGCGCDPAMAEAMGWRRRASSARWLLVVDGLSTTSSPREQELRPLCPALTIGAD